jgi:hypothetical protein
MTCGIFCAGRGLAVDRCNRNRTEASDRAFDVSDSGTMRNISASNIALLYLAGRHRRGRLIRAELVRFAALDGRLARDGAS